MHAQAKAKLEMLALKNDVVHAGGHSLLERFLSYAPALFLELPADPPFSSERTPGTEFNDSALTGIQ